MYIYIYIHTNIYSNIMHSCRSCGPYSRNAFGIAMSFIWYYYTYTYIYTYKYIHTYMYIHIYIHTYIYIYKYSHMQCVAQGSILKLLHVQRIRHSNVF